MTTPTPVPDDLDLARRLTVLAGRATPAPIDVDADLARGRRGVRRRRAAEGLGVVAAASVAAVVLVLVPGGTDPRGDRAPEPAGASGTPTTAVDPVTPAATTDRVLAVGETLDVQTPDDQVFAAARGFGEVLIDRLDPGHVHTATPQDGARTSASRSRVTSITGTVPWRVAGEDGQGKVFVTVGTRPGSAQWECTLDGWTCTDVDPPEGAVSARSATYDGGTEVMVVRPDGLVVTVGASTLDGNNSLVAVSGVDVDPAQLAAAATDPRLVLPDITPYPMTAFPLRPGDVDPVFTVGREQLVAAGESWQQTAGGLQPAGDGYSLPYVGRWTGPDGSGELSWDPVSHPSATFDATCQQGRYARCVAHSEGGRQVFVGYLARRGPGWQVWAMGPVRTISVRFEGTGLPVERAIAFALDPRLQQP